MATAGVICSNSKNSVSAPANDLHAMSDKKLVAAAKSGDADAFNELFKRHATAIFRATHRITRNREDAEDALQECFLSTFLHLKSFDGKAQFSTWLTRIAMNAALMKLRKNRVYQEIRTAEPEGPSELRPEYQLPDPSPTPEERYAKAEQAAILRDAITRLRPTIRKTVEVQLQDHSVDETAEVLGISVSAVKARLFHARAALRQTRLLVPSIWKNPEASPDPDLAGRV